MRRAPFALLLVLAPATALAQTAYNPAPVSAPGEQPITGSQLGTVGTMVQSVGEGVPITSASSPEDAAASRFAGYVAACTANRKPTLVDQYLHASGESAKAIWTQLNPSFSGCFKGYAFAMRYWGGLSMRFPEFLLRGKLAEARTTKLTAKRSELTPSGPMRNEWTSVEHADPLLLSIGACIGAAKPEPALALLRTAPGSKAELAETADILPDAKRRCVPTGQTLSVPMSNLRAAIALGLYHLLDGTAVATAKN